MAETKHIDLDAAVGRNLAVGGAMTVKGHSVLDGNLLVKGWLDAPNMRGPDRGMYATEELLKKRWPHPHSGWRAYVGASIAEAVLYLGYRGEWSEIGPADLDPNIEVDLTKVDALEDRVDNLSDRINQIREGIARINTEVVGLKQFAEEHEDRIAALEGATGQGVAVQALTNPEIDEIFDF